MAKRKNKFSQSKPIWLTILGLGALGVLIALLLRGNDIILFNPKGHIAEQQLRLLIISTALLLEIGIPTLVIFYYVAWKYRETNEKAAYDPTTKHHKSFTVFLWVIPTISMLLLTSVLLPATQKLEPQRSIAADNPPMTVQVVALRWKWLFIYPEQNIATVNYVQIPVDTPIQFELTADEAPMSSFWIPHLGGQLYAMTGHVNRLNLIADTLGEYEGSTAEINGAGFAGMRFPTHVSSLDDFDEWAAKTKQSSDALSGAEYAKLLVPSENHAAAFYSHPETDLYSSIVIKNSGSHQHYTERK